MAGDRVTESDNKGQTETKSGSLFEHSGFMDKIKHGASVVRDTTVDLVHKGVEKGDQIVHHPTTKKIAGEVAGAGKDALHFGQDVAHNPTTKKIVGQALSAGKEVGQEHVNSFNGVIAAGRKGDVHGVLQKGLPLAGEALMGPGAAALMIAKDKGAKIVIENLPPEQREAARKLKNATDIATTHPSNIPNLIITGKH